MRDRAGWVAQLVEQRTENPKQLFRSSYLSAFFEVARRDYYDSLQGINERR
jgi:citrate synthase